MTPPPFQWRTTTDVHRFLDVAWDFLAADPVVNTALLTETTYVARHPAPDAAQAYGWCEDGSGSVAAAFVQAPQHPPLLSPAPASALGSLPAALPRAARLGVDGRDAEAVVAAWRESGLELRPLQAIAVLRLADPATSAPLTDGQARTATRADRDLLADWFSRFKAEHPHDPSDLEFVVDDPLVEDGVVLWEVGGEPVAMASRTPVVAGTTRMGLVFSPAGDSAAEADVLAAGCTAARRTASMVLAMVRTDDEAATTALTDLGFEQVAERVLLGPGQPDA